MREIKFRAWDTTSKAMYDLNAFEDYPFSYIAKGDTPYTKFMQFTGLKDKNGKEIYEGDIVKVSEEYGGHAYSPLVVDFKDSCFVLRRINYMPDYNPMFKYDFTQVYEIVGNIYENPDLIEGNQHE